MSYRVGHVALVGRPNVGKSTLLNRLLGQKLAITSHKPQTTRHSILGIQSSDSGQIIYIDTPGIHKRGNKAMNRYLNRTATAALAGVDLVLFVVEAGHWTEEDDLVLARLGESRRPALLVVNKIDTIKPKERLLPLLDELSRRTGMDDLVPLSARTGDNCDTLERLILERLPEGAPLYPEDQLSDRSERFFAAELIREQLTRRYHKELPYAVTVEIEQFDERPHLLRIGAVVWVERPNQKAILLGKGGAAMKETASQARQALEEFFQKKVFLNLWIKVKKSWSSDQASLVKLGYTE